MRQFDPWLASLSLVPGAGMCCNMVWDAGIDHVTGDDDDDDDSDDDDDDDDDDVL